MSAYLPAHERALEIVDDLVHFLRVRRRRRGRHRHEHADVENDAADQDSDTSDDDDGTSSSNTSISSVSSSTSWEESALPHVPPQASVPPATSYHHHRRPLAIKLPALPSLRELLSPTRPRRDASKAQPASPGIHITSLPPELQILILRHLSFADIQRLRRTSRFYRSLVTKSLLRDMYGARLDSVLLSHCHLCHAHDPSRAALLYADITHPSYPYCSTCVACAAARDQLVAGHRVSMGNLCSARVCRWCGLPVLPSPEEDGRRRRHFHRSCYSRYGSALLAFLGFCWLQVAVMFVASALCLRHYHRDLRVVLPVALSILVYFCAVFVNCVRDPKNEGAKAYFLPFTLELAQLGLWIAPTYVIASIVASSAHVPGSTVATLLFSVLHLSFRLINTLGNLILATQPPLWRRKKPNLSRRARLLNPVTTLLVLLTFPRAVEQLYRRPRSGGAAGG